ncbi:hypothetical protein FPHYL_3692 [Fusarium phyllophilum]|uniref:Uncharacterized protein n=1 Tax=Fusarium phyllophilum TaxID=47803 RepID=A0A8H5K6Z3_9HYPO|nr:hypothetical protein FPHYL_3692 [Fusarium phyllophilum]
MNSQRPGSKVNYSLSESDVESSRLFSSLEVEANMVEMGKYLSKKNGVRVIAGQGHQKSGTEDMVLGDQNFGDFQELCKRSAVLVCIINRFIMKPGISDIPKDKKRLRVSSSMFRSLTTAFDASPCFVSSMISGEILTGLGTRMISRQNGNQALSFWYTLPIRTASPCFDEEGTHALSVIGSNQVDPNGYLHLADIKHDIRPSRIGVYSWHDGLLSRTVIVDFQDGRLHAIADEPYRKIKEMIARTTDHGPLDLHTALLSSSELNVLEDNAQQLASPALDFECSARHLAIQKSLHSTMSHLQRYKTELGATEEIVADLQVVSKKLYSITKPALSSEETDSEVVDENIVTIRKHISGARAVLLELEIKTEAIVELLSDVVKSRNDMLMVNNGTMVRKLLKSARKQNKASQTMMRESQKMASDMRKDSVSMKTIALLTMAFLPATSIAAVLSMPFFSEQKWFNNPVKAWLWAVLTVPATVASVGIYLFLTRKEMRSSKSVLVQDEEDDMESVDFVLNEL